MIMGGAELIIYRTAYYNNNHMRCFIRMTYTECSYITFWLYGNNFGYQQDTSNILLMWFSSVGARLSG